MNHLPTTLQSPPADPIGGRMAAIALKALSAGFGRIFGQTGGRGAAGTVQPAKEVGRAEFHAATLEPGQAVFYRAGEMQTMPASRVVIVPLEAGKNVNVGRIWLYLYPEKNLVKRVFRVEDPQVRSILRIRKNSFYMDDAEWSANGGDQELERIRHEAAMDVQRLVTAAGREREQRSRKASQPKATCGVGGIEIASPSPSPSKKVAPPSASADAPTPPPKAASSEVPAAPPTLMPVAGGGSAPSIQRPVAGEARVGVIAEMGKIPRQGQSESYLAFCLQLEANGVHYPYYGVELEREVLTRQAAVGDQVKITFMGKIDIGNGRTKNLHKVEVLRKGVKEVR